MGEGDPQAQRAEDRPLLSGTARGLGAGVPRPASVWRDVVCGAFTSDWSVSLVNGEFLLGAQRVVSASSHPFLSFTGLFFLLLSSVCYFPDS